MLTHRFDDALGLAAGLHRSQTRKVSGIPYIAHLLSVSALVLEHDGDEDQAIAGLLHDAIEDQGGQATARLIEERFGLRVRHIVEACSDSDGENKAPWQIRKRAYLDSIAQKGDDALLVTTCDKLHNATSILEDLRRQGAPVFDRFTADRTGTLWYYRAISDALNRHFPCNASTRLDEVVGEVERLSARL